MADLARRFKISDYSVRKILASAGVRMGAPGLTNMKIEQVRELHGQGWSAARIHRKTSLSEAAVILVLATDSSKQTPPDQTPFQARL